MVQAGHLHLRVRVRHQRRVQQRHVRHVRQGALVELRVVGQPALRAEPDDLLAGGVLVRLVALRGHHADVPVAPLVEQRTRAWRAQLALLPQLLGVRHRAHLVRVVRAGVAGDVEAGLHAEDRLAALHAADLARGEAAAVAQPVDEEDGRLARVARAQEVTVQGVHRALVVDGVDRGDQRLAGDLPAEGARQRALHGRPPEDQVVDALQRQDLFDTRHGGCRSFTLRPVSAAGRPRGPRRLLGSLCHPRRRPIAIPRNIWATSPCRPGAAGVPPGAAAARA